jgi:hypothetical protein
LSGKRQFIPLLYRKTIIPKEKRSCAYVAFFFPLTFFRTAARNENPERPAPAVHPEWAGQASAAASLIPNFDFIAIRVGDVGVRVAWAEFASPEQLAAGVRDFVDGRVDVAG